MHSNPLIDWEVLPPFEHIRAEHIEPAVDAVLAENRLQLQNWKRWPSQVGRISSSRWKRWMSKCIVPGRRLRT